MKLSTGKIHTIMKTKNIFLTAISALFIFAACSEEKIIDEPGISGKGDLVIELSPSSVITKAADTNDGYVYATEQELNVDDCWIFVFKGEDCITSQYFSGADLLATDNNYTDTPGPNGESLTYKKGYKVTLKGLNHGTYDFWVVANPTETNTAYESCQSLSALKGIIEGGATYKAAFADKADQLVKVGNKSAKFDANTAANPIQIPLTQLAARVELKVQVDIPRKFINGYYDYGEIGSKNGILTLNDIRTEFGDLNNIDISNEILQSRDDNKNLLYTYFGYGLKIPESVKPQFAKGIPLPPLTVKKYSTYKGSLLKNIELRVDKIRIKSSLASSVIVPNDEYDEIFNPVLDKISTTYLFQFYTYTKDKLDISLHGSLSEATYQTAQEGEIKNSLFVNDKVENGTPKLISYIRDSRGEIPEGEILKLEGGNGWGSEKIGLLLTNENAWTSLGEAIEKEFSTGTGKAYSSGSVSLNPDGGFKVGNMYEASLLIQSVPTTGTLNVVIDGIKEYESDIKFEFN